MSSEVVDPSLLSQLSHKRVDPGKSCTPVFPALEPRFYFCRIDSVCTSDEAGGGGDDRREMPGDEADVGIPGGLGKGVAEGCLCSEIHVSEEQLADEVRWDGAGFTLRVRVHDVLSAPVKLSHGK